VNMAETRQDTYEVTCLESGDTISYEIRGLRDEDEEIQRWADFCASVFRYKENPPPASYFERHYRNDPNRVASLIRVALHQGQMVASCRLFLRTVSSGAGSLSLSAGGIGEVCTADDHRRRGLSKVLLRNVMEIMKERQLQVSLLHAAPAFFPVYEKAGGYACTMSHWSVVPVSTSKLQIAATEHIAATEIMIGTDSPTIREASFPEDTDRLSRLHRNYSEQRFAGCILRSTDYWNTYLSIELKGTLWVKQVEGTLVAWLSLRPRGEGRFQVREFGVDTEFCSTSGVTTSILLTMLLSHAMQEIQISSGSDNMLELATPTFLLDECRSSQADGEGCLPYIDWAKLKNDDDLGWMYKILDEKVPIESINGSQTPHLIWPADSF
jgi:hypothetical protein